MNLPSVALEPLSLLYVEDEIDTRTVLTSMIGTKYPDIQLVAAENGLDGLEFYRRHPTDILVTDISMPHMDGLQMSRRIKEINPEVMIIVITARTDTQYLLDCIDIGIHQYVLKPIDSLHLFATIGECIDTITNKRMVAKQHDLIVQINERLEARTKELETLNHELEAFNFTVSHDLRTPLTVISGYCQVLKEIYGPSLDAEGRGFIREISSGIHQMSDLISTLLNFSRINRAPLSISSVDLSGMAIKISEQLRIAYPTDRKVHFLIKPGVHANGDKALFKVLLENLLGNAWKYTSTREEALIEFGFEATGDRQVYFVRDNGVGFDTALSERIFVPFQRLDNSKDIEGNGIGLATVKRIIERHGGEIWAEGKVGRGATFSFTLGESSPPGERDALSTLT